MPCAPGPVGVIDRRGRSNDPALTRQLEHGINIFLGIAQADFLAWRYPWSLRLRSTNTRAAVLRARMNKMLYQAFGAIRDIYRSWADDVSTLCCSVRAVRDA